MLALLHERVFHQGRHALQVPLQSAVLASNEMPPSGTSALWDRCLVRHTVRYLQHDDNRMHLMLGSLPPPPAPGSVSLDDVQVVRDLAQQVLLPLEVAKALGKLYNNLAAKGIIVSDRRQVQAIGFLRAVAALQGDTEIGDEHLGRLSSVLWERPEQLKEVEKLLEPLAASWRPHVKHFTALLDGSRAALRTQQARSTPDLQECASILRTTQDMQTAMQAQLRKHAHRPPVAGLFEATKHLLTEVTTLVKKATGVV
jgi:MoxR-like ATPase